jgi:hypothetical protein
MTKCQHIELMDNGGKTCRKKAHLSITYPTGAIGPQWWRLNTECYITILRDDHLNSDEYKGFIFRMVLSTEIPRAN